MISLYPSECLAFEYKGTVYEGRPSAGCDKACYRPMITLVDGERFVEILGEGWLSLSEIKPLTKAARDLLDWAGAP